MHKLDKVFWNKISDVWLQKVTISQAGLVQFSYHYEVKSTKSCVVFEIDTKISRHYAAYVLIEKDLRDTLAFLEEYKKILADKNYKEKNILLKALVRAMVITYGKCFIGAIGRKVKLGDDFISEDNRVTHENLMNMRHEYVAHAGDSEHESCKFVFLLPPETKYRRGKLIYPKQCTELRQTIREEYFVERYKPLIEEVHANVKNKLSSLEDKINFYHIPLEAFYKFSKNKGNRIIINDDDLNKFILDTE